MAPIQSFPVFELPDELVIRVVKMAFDPWDLQIEHDEYLGDFHYKGFPEYNLLLSCKKFNPIAEEERKKAFTGTFILLSSPEIHKEAFLNEWKGPPKEFSWLLGAVETLKVNGMGWAVRQTFVNLKCLEIDMPPDFTCYFTDTDNLEDIFKHNETNIKALKTQEARERSRLKWGLSNDNKCTLVSSFRLIYGGSSVAAWPGEVLVKFSMKRYTTKILELAHHETTGMAGNLHLVQG